MAQHPRLKRRINGRERIVLRAFHRQLSVALELLRAIMEHVSRALSDTALHDARSPRLADPFVQLQRVLDLSAVGDLGQERGEHGCVFDRLRGTLGAGETKDANVSPPLPFTQKSVFPLDVFLFY